MGHDHICKVLLQNGAAVDAVRCDGATPLFKAAHKGHAAVVTELLKHRPNLTLLPVSKFFKRRKKTVKKPRVKFSKETILIKILISFNL